MLAGTLQLPICNLEGAAVLADVPFERPSPSAGSSPRSPLHSPQGRNSSELLEMLAGTGPAAPVDELPSGAPTGNSDCCTDASHVQCWSLPEESVLILDWDDTLFPTTYVWNDPNLHWSRPAPCFEPGGDADPELRKMRELLEQHTSTLAGFLRLAVCLGHVVIVTLAEECWVEMSIRHFLPGLEGLLEELGIEVIYAKAMAAAARHRHFNLDDDGYDPGKDMKGKAMAAVLKRFYGGRSGRGTAAGPRSWKNVVSIGDSLAERWALQDVIFQKKQQTTTGRYKMCHCKVVKLLTEPDLQHLMMELQVLTSWLGKLVWHDGDVDLDLGELADFSPDSPLPRHCE